MNTGTAYPQHGLTLLELLIALSVFAVVSVMAYTGLQSIIIADERIEYHSKKLLSLQRAVLTIGQDLSFLAGRNIRDQYGDVKPAFISSEQGEYQIEFTKSSWFNPAGLPRSNLQRVGYGLKDDELIRYNWITLDQAHDSEPFKTTLLKNVEKLEVRLMDEAKKWHDSWPPLGMENPKQPAGIEVVITLTELGKIRRLYRTTEFQW